MVGTEITQKNYLHSAHPISSPSLEEGARGSLVLRSELLLKGFLAVQRGGLETVLGGTAVAFQEG